MADPRDDDPPRYTLYRARPKWLSRERGLREPERAPDGYEKPPRRRKRITVWRVVRWLAAALAAWLLISLVLFLVSAQVESAKVSDAAKAQLGGAGFILTSPNTILVLGSD